MIRAALLLLLAVAAPAAAQSPAASLGDGFKANADKPLDIESDTLDVDDKRKLATFRGTVVARQGDFTLRAAEIVVTYTAQDATPAASPVATATANPLGQGGADISRIEAKGRVDVTAKDQRSQSNWAIFEVKKQQVTIGGDVTLTQGKNVLKGERMVIDLATGLTKMDAIGGQSAGRLRAVFTPKPKAGEAGGAPAAPAGAGAAAPGRNAPASVAPPASQPRPPASR